MSNKDKVIYIPRPDREAKFLKDLLKRFKGVLIPISIAVMIT